MSDDAIPLVEVLRALRAQLSQAAAEGQAEAMRFEIHAVEIELVGVISTEAGADAKAAFKVLGAGAELGGAGKVSDARTHRIKLTLTPKVRDDAPGGGGGGGALRNAVLGPVKHI